MAIICDACGKLIAKTYDDHRECDCGALICEECAIDENTCRICKSGDRSRGFCVQATCEPYANDDQRHFRVVLDNDGDCTPVSTKYINFYDAAMHYDYLTAGILGEILGELNFIVSEYMTDVHGHEYVTRDYSADKIYTEMDRWNLYGRLRDKSPRLLECLKALLPYAEQSLQDIIKCGDEQERSQLSLHIKRAQVLIEQINEI